jgi:hypothetical protein
MTWFNVIKVDEVDNVRAIITNHQDDLIDYWSNFGESLAPFRDNLPPNIETQIQGIVRIITMQKDQLENFKANFEEFLDKENIVGATSEEEIRIGLRDFLIATLQSMQNNPALEPGQFPAWLLEGLGLTEPQQLNYDRLIRRLEMGEGYEE